eukprot:INCI16510.1.p2 GENE.INCI16510.1~~INCI16510.1.p2  ORF type:complete len:127 (+),score=37.77 INCI16510.1:241-621(+)
MSEMGVNNNTNLGAAIDASPTECSTPSVAQKTSLSHTPAADDVENGVLATPTSAATSAATPLQEQDAAPVVKKKLKKKKKKAGGYKSFLKKALKSSSSDKEKKQRHLDKISRTLGGGAFDKMDDKL